MLAAMHGKIDCVLKLLQADANVREELQNQYTDNTVVILFEKISNSYDFAPDLDVRLGAREDLPPPRGVLRPRRLPAGHPRRRADHAGGRLMVRSSSSCRLALVQL